MAAIDDFDANGSALPPETPLPCHHDHPQGRRLLKHFAAFAHNLRRCTAGGAIGDVHVDVLSDSCVVVHPGAQMPALLVEPRLTPGPTGLELFVHCRETRHADASAADPLPLVAAWRCNSDGAVGRHPDSSGRTAGYLCDSVTAVGILEAVLDDAMRRHAAKALHAEGPGASVSPDTAKSMELPAWRD